MENLGALSTLRVLNDINQVSWTYNVSSNIGKLNFQDQLSGQNKTFFVDGIKYLKPEGPNTIKHLAVINS